MLQPLKTGWRPFCWQRWVQHLQAVQGWVSFPSLTRQEAPHESGISVITEDESDSMMPVKRVYLSKDHLVITQIPFQLLFPFPPLSWCNVCVSSLWIGPVLLSRFAFSFLPQFTWDSSPADLCRVLQALWRLRGIFMTFRKYLQDARRVSGISQDLIKDSSS